MTRWAAICAVLVLAVAGCATAQTPCSQKDRDYCEVDNTCFWNSQTSQCDAVSCSKYNDHSYCSADPEDLGPCTWDWTLRVCYPRNGDIPCSSYWEDCPTDRCAFSSNVGVCYPKDGNPPCFGFFEQSDCNQATGCTFVGSTCYSSAEAHACSIHYTESDCPADHCTFHSTTQICYPSDLEIPCRMYPGAENCPTDRCRAAPIAEGASACVDKDHQLPCTEFVDATYCPETRCAFNSEAQRCYDPQVGLDCDAFIEAANCPQDHCRVVNGICMDQEQPMDCSIFYYGSSDCNKDAGCRPDCDSQICVACPGSGACDDTPCPDVNPVDPDNCSTHSDEPTCNSDADCEWSATVEACVDKSIGVPCSDYLEEGQCSDKPDCVWDNGVCVSCTGPDCHPVTTTPTPDSGNDCDTYTVDTCPFPRCTFHYAAGSEEGTCADTTCRDVYDQNVCTQMTGCSFNTEAYVCYSTADGPPCSYFGSQSSCGTYPTCQWDAKTFQCAGRDTGKACSTYKSSNCPTRCSIQFESDTCIDKSCREFYEKAECIAADCTYDDAANICYKDSGKSCSQYSNYNDCPPNRCAFRWNTQGTGGECGDRACVDAYTEADCDAIPGCSFLASINLCYKDTGKVCESYHSYENCPQNRCSWYSSDGQNFVCSSKVCSDFFQEDMCATAGCQWDAATYSCFNDTHLSCDKYDIRTCPTNRCVYDYNFGMCRTFSCGDYFDKASCAASDLNCEFSDQYGVCHIKNEPIPCAVFNYNPDQCPSDRCVWASDVKICYPQGGKVPCGEIYDKTPCQTRDYCTWNTNDYRCVSSSA